MTLAQNSTPSTPTGNPGYVIIAGHKYVLVPEKTFGKMELMTAEVPALRDENKSQAALIDNLNKTIAKDAQVIEAKDKTLEATERALQAEKDRADALEKAQASERQANEILKAKNAELEAKVQKANKRALIAIAAAVGSILLFH